MITIGEISGSALRAYSVGQQVTANNLSNVSSDNFMASKTVYSDVGASGVAASILPTEDSVDISREATNLISNTNAFKANLKSVKVADEMAKELFSIKA